MEPDVELGKTYGFPEPDGDAIIRECLQQANPVVMLNRVTWPDPEHVAQHVRTRPTRELAIDAILELVEHLGYTEAANAIRDMPLTLE